MVIDEETVRGHSGVKIYWSYTRRCELENRNRGEWSEWSAQMEVLEGVQLLTMERKEYNHKRGWLDMS